MSIQTNAKLLIEASTQVNLKDVERLISISDPTNNNSEALRSSKWNIRCIELLISVSDPKAKDCLSADINEIGDTKIN